MVSKSLLPKAPHLLQSSPGYSSTSRAIQAGNTLERRRWTSTSTTRHHHPPPHHHSNRFFAHAPCGEESTPLSIRRKRHQHFTCEEAYFISAAPTCKQQRRIIEEKARQPSCQQVGPGGQKNDITPVPRGMGRSRYTDTTMTTNEKKGWEGMPGPCQRRAAGWTTFNNITTNRAVSASSAHNKPVQALKTGKRIVIPQVLLLLEPAPMKTRQSEHLDEGSHLHPQQQQPQKNEAIPITKAAVAALGESRVWTPPNNILDPSGLPSLEGRGWTFWL